MFFNEILSVISDCDIEQPKMVLSLHLKIHFFVEYMLFTNL